MQMEETVLTFKIPDDTGNAFIDIAKCMSMVNRKLYRQQGLWTVLGVNFYADVLKTATGVREGLPYSVSISGAPRNWVTRNALVKMFHLWIEQQRHASDSVSESIRPTWEDFKVYLSDLHRTTGDITPVAGHMFGPDNPYQIDEWVHSKIVFEEVDGAGAVVEHEPLLHIVGADNGNTIKGCITQYARSRAIVHSPDPVVFGDVEDTLFSVATDPLAAQMQEVIENMKVDNDEPPYQANAYPGGGTNGNIPLLYGYVSALSGATIGRKTSMNGFAAPNGLIELRYQMTVAEDQTAASAELWVELVVGRRVDY